MSKVAVNPDDLRRFAQELKRFNIELQGQMSSIHGRFNRLGQTWQDQEHAKFAQSFSEAMRILGRFTNESTQHIPYLLRKAEQIDAYLDRG